MSSLDNAYVEITFGDGTLARIDGTDDYVIIGPDPTHDEEDLRIDDARWILLQGLRTVLQNGG